MRRTGNQHGRSPRRGRGSSTSLPASPRHGASSRSAVEWRSLVAWSLAGLLVVAVLVSALSIDRGDVIDSGSEALAWEACRGEVLGRLREPATALFPPFGDASFQDRDPVWTVAAHVDADNTFGDLARERWVCTIEFRTSGARLVELELTPVALD